jgi:hypothetical protein
MSSLNFGAEFILDSLGFNCFDENLRCGNKGILISINLSTFCFEWKNGNLQFRNEKKITIVTVATTKQRELNPLAHKHKTD